MTITAEPRLVDLAHDLAARPEEWIHRVRLSSDGRWYERLHQDEDRETWLLSWLPGQSTGFHDHGDSRGAFAIALGSLQEHNVGQTRTLTPGHSRSFGPGYIHDVRNTTNAPAISVHVYSPPLTVMNRYDLTNQGLTALPPERAGDW